MREGICDLHYYYSCLRIILHLCLTFNLFGFSLSAKNSEIEDSMLELANKKRDIRLLTEEVEGQRSALEAQRKKNNVSGH